MGDEHGATVVMNFTEKEKIPDDVEVGVQINGGNGKEEEAYKESVKERSVGVTAVFNGVHYPFQLSHLK